jgi:outer membrane receptor for ferrienterochelin and colicin
MKSVTQIAAIVAALTIAMPHDIVAQDKTDLTSMSLADLLNVNVTTASKVSQKAGEAPANVIVITANQIRTRGYRNLAEVLNDLPDIKVNDKSDPQTYNTFSIRGISGQDKFVILMDGVKISSPINDKLPILENYPIYLAKQIEVVFGPGSALYGADAMAGVINIITEKDIDQDLLEASVMACTHGYSNQNLLWRKTLNSGLTITAGGQFTYDQQPDFSKVYANEFSMESHQTGTFNSAYGIMTPEQPIDAEYSAPVKTYNAYLSLEKRGFDFKLLHYYSQVPSSTTLTPQNGVFNKDVFYGQGLTSASANYTDSIGSVRSVTSVQGCFADVNPQSNYRNHFGRMEPGYKYSNGSMIKIDEQLTASLSRQLQVMGGLTYEIFQALPKSVELASPQSRDAAVEGTLLNSAEYYKPDGIAAKFYSLAYNNVGSFVQARYSPVNKLAITLGGRYDHNSRFGSTVNPRAGVVYSHSAKTTIKAMYGSAYWAPSPHVAYEQYGSFFSTDSGRTYASNFWHLPNPGLKPTTSKTFELNLNQQVSNHFSFSLTGYYTRLHGLIAGVSDNGNTNLYNNHFLGYPVSYIEVPVNAGVQKNYGGNVLVNGVFDIGGSRFNAWGSVSFVDGTVMEYATPSKLTEVEIPLVAPWQFRAGVDGSSGAFSYSVRVLRSGRQRLTRFENPDQPYSREQLAGYTLVNASVSYSFKERLSFFVRGVNLLNQRYRLLSIVEETDNGMSTVYGSFQDPLRITAGLTVSL